MDRGALELVEAEERVEKLRADIRAQRRAMKACNIKEATPDNNSQDTATLAGKEEAGEFL
jgi:hypothetical protein